MDDHEIALNEIESDVKPKNQIQIGKDGLPVDVIPEDDDHVIQEKPHKEKRPGEEFYESESSSSSGKGSEEKLPLLHRVHRFATVMNLLNSMLGAGILSVPSAFVSTGIIVSIIVSIIIAAISYACTVLVVKLSFETNTEGLGDLTYHILKKPGAVILTILNLIFLVTAMVAYLILGGDMITSWFDLGGIDVSSGTPRMILILVYACVFPIILTIPRDISFMKYFSTATVFSIIFFMISLIYKISAYSVQNRGINPTCSLAKIDFNIFSSISIYGLSYALPAVVLPAIRLYNPALKKRIIVTFIGIVMCFVLITVPGITGYSIFGENTDGNILKNFDSDDILMIICRCCFFIVVSCAYPMLSQSVMSMWAQLIFGEDQHSTLILWKRILVVILNNVIPVALAMFLPTAKPILTIGGAFGGCIVDFVYPSIMYIVFHRNDYSWHNWRNILCVLCALFGLATAAIATYQAVIDAINSLK